MKIQVVNEFYDKFHTSVLFKEGMVLDFEESRAKDIIARGLGKAVVESAPEPKAEKPEVTDEVADKAPVVEEKTEVATDDNEANPADEAPAEEEEVKTDEAEEANAEEVETADVESAEVAKEPAAEVEQPTEAPADEVKPKRGRKAGK
jgi:hypothetical protein